MINTKSIILHHANKKANKLFSNYVEAINKIEINAIEINIRNYIEIYGLKNFELKINSLIIENKIDKIYYINPGWDFLLGIEFLHKLKQKKIKFCIFNFDTEYYFECADRYYAQIAELIILCDSITMPEYKLYGFNAEVFGSLYDTKVYKNKKYIRDIDVSFIGNVEVGNRKELIENIRNNGINIKEYGLGTNTGPLSEKQMIDIYNRSKIVICPSGHYDIELMPYGISSVRKHIFQAKGRPIESAMCGALVLAEDTEGVRNLFKVGEEIETYYDISDAIIKIKKYLNNPELLNKIANNGMRKTLNYDINFSMSKIVCNFNDLNIKNRKIYIDRVYYINRFICYVKIVFWQLINMRLFALVGSARPIVEPRIILTSRIFLIIKKLIKF
jgi:hypothetical protein